MKDTSESTRMRVSYTQFESRIGKLSVAVADGRLCRIGFENEDVDAIYKWLVRHFPEADIEENADPNTEVIAMLTEYLSLERTEFDCDLILIGGPFQIRVWNALRAIPFGKTTTYGALAHELGSPEGAQAIGMANATNPIPIVVPCHRVLGSDGSLTGFAGGLHIKKFLLELEGVLDLDLFSPV